MGQIFSEPRLRAPIQQDSHSVSEEGTDPAAEVGGASVATHRFSRRWRDPVWPWLSLPLAVFVFDDWRFLAAGCFVLLFFGANGREELLVELIAERGTTMPAVIGTTRGGSIASPPSARNRKGRKNSASTASFSQSQSPPRHLKVKKIESRKYRGRGWLELRVDLQQVVGRSDEAAKNKNDVLLLTPDGVLIAESFSAMDVYHYLVLRCKSKAGASSTTNLVPFDPPIQLAELVSCAKKLRVLTATASRSSEESRTTSSRT